jgi:hypothetical protein
MARDRRQVLGRRVSLVPIVPVPRIGGVMRGHLAIARDLGDDRRGRDRAAPAIAVQQASSEARWMLISSISVGWTAATDQASALRVMTA